MTTDPYAPCPCGSGKKFKWCCQPIYAGINHALEQDANGQHEAALRTIDEVAREHGGNPEVWGQKARLLFANEKPEEADAVLQKAFDLNPNYPFGLWLRAVLRYQEGEAQGALLLARRAADAYDPQARDYLAQIYKLIFEVEMAFNRPVAARAALRQVLHLHPVDEEARRAFEQLSGPESRLPACARRDYAFRKPAAGAAGPRRAAWDQALAAASARLGDLARAFDALAQGDPADAAAWFNLGLSRAWLGDNAAALEALDRYLGLESDEAAGAEAAALGEVLRCGQGLEEQSDYQEYAFAHAIRNPEPVQKLISEWAQGRRLIPLPTEQESVFAGILLEMTATPLVTVGGPPADAGRFAAYLGIAGNVLQVTSTVKEPFERLREEVRNRLGLGLGELRERRGPAHFSEVVSEALLFPLTESETAGRRVLEHAQQFYEDTWIHRPRRSLEGNAPVDAAGHAKLRKKLRGVIQFIQDCARHGMLAQYDFDRLRRKLGLGSVSAPAAPGAAAPAAVPADLSALGAAELAGVPLDALSDDQLEQAYQAAHRLDAAELTGRFAQALVGRPPRAEKPDRFPWYSYLIQKALKDGDTGAALDLVNEGEKADCEQNEGRRRNEYELRRGQVHVKRGEVEAAQDVFQRLIERVPANLRYRGQAAEAMLALKQGARALRFAEEGLAAARQANDRDSEQYLMELAAAARKQAG
jgi:tetratricopeptide (TPR) repeat protein